MRALIDGDVLVYQAGFASDQREYECPDGVKMKYMKDAKIHCDNRGLDKKSIRKHVTAEPLEYCLYSVKKMIKGIMESNSQHIFIQI